MARRQRSMTGRETPNSAAVVRQHAHRGGAAIRGRPRCCAAQGRTVETCAAQDRTRGTAADRWLRDERQPERSAARCAAWRSRSRARATTGASTMRPSTRAAAPLPAAATTRSAQASCSAVGRKAALTAATWRGWMHSLPPKPKRRARASSAASTPSSSSAVQTPSMGAAESAEPGGQHDARTEVVQRQVGVVDAELGLQVEAPEGQAGDTGRARDRVDALEPGGRLDDRDHRAIARHGAHLLDMDRLLGLGQHHHRHLRVATRHEVAFEPRRAAGIDADGRAMGDPGKRRAGGFLVLRGHRILEVDDRDVGTAGERLADAIRTRRRHEQQAAARRAASSVTLLIALRPRPSSGPTRGQPAMRHRRSIASPASPSVTVPP